MSATQTATSTQPNGFVRFIDAIGNFFKKAAPVIHEVENVAQAAEPILALTPFGPEYDLVTNAIVAAQQTGEASLAAGTSLTGTQKMALVIQAISPGLTTILASKGITETQAQEAAISQFAQNVYNLQTGPVAVTTPATAAAPAAAN